jgi:hypothetical protein
MQARLGIQHHNFPIIHNPPISPSANKSEVLIHPFLLLHLPLFQIQFMHGDVMQALNCNQTMVCIVLHGTFRNPTNSGNVFDRCTISTHSVKCDSKLGLYGGLWVVGVVVENVVIMDEV